jgi:SNF2 family DNA or RNA helicase
MPELWKPHNYQISALSFLLTNPHSGLFLDPGLGKTSTSLAAIKVLKNAEEITGVLMIAPLRVAYMVWPNEISKWENFKDVTHTILHGKTKDTLWGCRKDIYLINPEGLPWLYNELLDGISSGKKCPFDTLWIDESTKFKNSSSNRFKLIKDMLPLFKRRHIMTGTPAPRSLNDLWSQAYILDNGEALSSNYYKFRKKYFQADDWNKFNWQLRAGADKKIHDSVAHLVLEMSSKDYLNLPPLMFNYIKVKLPTKALMYYKQMEKDFFLELDGSEISASASAQASMKCHQIANGSVYEDIPDDLTEDEEREFRLRRKTIGIHKAKIEALKDLIDELNGKPLLIAYHYKHDLLALQKLLGEDLPYIGTGVTPAQAKVVETSWNNGELPVMAGHPVSMAHGLNLQGSGNDIVWFSLTWNLEDYLQFNARIYRQGVDGVVRIHHLVADDTVDEAMLLRLGERDKEQHDLRAALRAYRLNITS